MTGLIKESFGYWIERMCMSVVEPTARRRVTYKPENMIMRGAILGQYLSANEDQIPKIEDFLPPNRRTLGISDVDNRTAKLLGQGKRYIPTITETTQILQYLKCLELVTINSTVIFVFFFFLLLNIIY